MKSLISPTTDDLPDGSNGDTQVLVLVLQDGEDEGSGALLEFSFRTSNHHTGTITQDSMLWDPVLPLHWFGSPIALLQVTRLLRKYFLSPNF